MSAATESGESAIWKRIIRPESGGWPAAAARAILDLGFEARDRQAMADLLDRSNAGSLSEDERQLLQDYCHVGTMLELLQSRARLSLRAGADS